MDHSVLLDFLLTRVELFAGFPRDNLERMIAGSRIGTFEPHEAIIEFGEENRSFFVLIDGEAEVAVTDDRGDTRRLALLRRGDFFGEISLMTGDRTIADVIGVTRCAVLCVPDHLFISIVASHPPALRLLGRSITARSVSFTERSALKELAASAERRSADPYGFRLTTEKPLKILVVNCGSSSLKYALFDTADDSVAATGVIDNIGLPNGNHRFTVHAVRNERPSTANNCIEAITDMIALLSAGDNRCIQSPEEINCVGHRVAHGGDRFTDSVVITDAVIAGIEDASRLAPLHNPVNLQGIRAAQRAFPSAHHVAVFDTAFHHTLPPYAFLYGLPYELYDKKHIRRYGFHGTSHRYVGLRAAQFLKRPFNSLEIISCHLGNGASMCAIDHGRSVDTTMGLTPTAGLIMGSRCGDIDPGIVTHLQIAEGYTAADCERLFNKESGLLGLSGVSSDMRAVEAAADAGVNRALLAVKCFGYQVRKTIGAYVAAMQGLDAVIFTGGIGQGSAGVRNYCCQGLECMGIRIDEAKNRTTDCSDGPCDISVDDAPVRILVIAADEERMIARETLRALRTEQITAAFTAGAKEPIPIEVSAHHVHLNAPHVEALFGAGHTLTPQSGLSQPGQFACKEQLTLVGPKGSVERVRVLGPARKETQVEISMTEQFKLGIHPPIRESGDLDNTPGVTLQGSAGEVILDHGVICAMRHIHMSPLDALNYGVRDGYVVRVRIEGDRELVFGDVLVRVNPAYTLAMHIDTDEANAAHIAAGATGVIEEIQERR
ncbi:MAG: acetate/propionate family kinase [Chitinispirillaceae bacterium]|nr:acetate/propionate family kinase [Chitinispirillaceae bacterium]